MNLSFTPNGGDDILNTTVRDSETGSIVYAIETPKFAGGALATTVTRKNQIDGTTRFAFRLLWKGAKASLEDAMVVLDNMTLEEVSARQVLESVPGSRTYGSVCIDDVDYRWKSKGTGSKIVLVDKDTKNTVAQSHSRVRGGFFRKPRDMNLEISEPIVHAVDVVLMTFILVWHERQSERAKNLSLFHALEPGPLSPLPVPVDYYP